jgi:hypothetical protein
MAVLLVSQPPMNSMMVNPTLRKNAQPIRFDES